MEWMNDSLVSSLHFWSNAYLCSASSPCHTYVKFSCCLLSGMVKETLIFNFKNLMQEFLFLWLSVIMLKL